MLKMQTIGGKVDVCFSYERGKRKDTDASKIALPCKKLESLP